MRVETLYVHCLRPDRPDGTVFTGELDVVSNGGLAAPQVIDKVSGEKLCSLPLDRANRLDRLAKSGRISYKIVCVGPWRHKQYVSARIQVVLNDGLDEISACPLAQRLRHALLTDLCGEDLRRLLDEVSEVFNSQSRPDEARLAYWLLWGRLGLEDENDPVLVRERRLHPEGIDAIKERGRRKGLSPNYLSLGPEDVREDIVKRLTGYHVVIHSDTETDYDCLEDEFDFVVEIQNPVLNGPSLLLEFSAEFTIFFGACHVHYAPDVASYENDFLNDVRRILDGRLSAVSLWAGGEWIQSDFYAYSLSSTAEWNEVIKLFGPIHREFRKKLDESPGVVKVENWLPEKAFQIHGGNAGRNEPQNSHRQFVEME